MNTTPTPSESAAAATLAKALLEFILAIGEGNAQRDRARPREQITVKVEQPPPASPASQPSEPRPDSDRTPSLLRAKEAAAYLAISERLLWTLTAGQQIPRIKLGRSTRYSVEDLDEYVRRQTKRRR